MRNVTITRTPALITAIIEHEATREVVLDRASANRGWTISSDDSVTGIRLADDNAMLALIKVALTMMDRAEAKEVANDAGR